MLAGKTIVLGVTGSIACYKAVDLASQLVQAGARVDVVMTHSATEFVRPLSFQAITGQPVIVNLFEQMAQLNLPHIALADRADAIVVAPATANILAKLALGMADDVLTCTALATHAPILIAPAMEANMYAHPATQEHLVTLRSRGCTIVEPAYGRLASGKIGQGRMAEPRMILGHVKAVIGQQRGDLAGVRVLVTAGGTQEPIDPVRVITNRSSGKMGYALAEAARDRGCSVTLISSPTALPQPVAVDLISVTSAEEMQQAILSQIPSCDVLIMAAAVADFRPAAEASAKIKRGQEELLVRLTPTPDILAEIGRESAGRLVLVGFAAETENLLPNARDKLRRKGLDLIVANDVTAEGSGFGSDTNKVWIVGPDREEDVPLLPKYEVAHRILDAVRNTLQQRRKALAGR